MKHTESAAPILYETRRNVAVITLNRPERLNALLPSAADDIVRCLDQADADDAVRAVVFTGAGRAFCAGQDLAGGADSFRAPTRDKDGLDGGGTVALRLLASRKPLIAAVNGPAAGIGATLTLPMDVRFLSPRAHLRFPFARLGIVPESCSSWFLQRVVGLPTALDWMISGRVVPADEAADKGLAVRADNPLSSALKYAEELAAHTAPVSVALTRRLLWDAAGWGDPGVAHREESRLLNIRFADADVEEGVRAFLEKRRPRFSDRVSGSQAEA